MPEDFEIYSRGLVCLSVCSCLSLEETVKRVNAEHPTGIQSRWSLSEDKTFAGGQSNPCQCDHNPDTHKYYLLNC